MLRRPFALVVVGLLGWASAPNRTARAAEACCACSNPTATSPGPSRTDPPARSIFTLPPQWETDHGRHVSLEALRGHPLVAAMFFTTCHVSCPITVETLTELERRLPASDRTRVAFLLVTLDPNADTPTALGQYRQDHRLSPAWTLLRGTLPATRLFADTVGIVYRQESFRLFHQPQIVVIDSTGLVVARFPGLHPSIESLLGALSVAK